MMMEPTGKTIELDYQGRRLRLCNQRCRNWTHPYGYLDNDNTLSHAGCGIFSIVNASEWLTGVFHDPDELAQFSLDHGGRGDDGTDRPVLLQAMTDLGLAREYGFDYHGDGLRNDLDTLYTHLLNGNAALCNLRVGHIVAIIGARERDGVRQVLAADPYSESMDSRVTDHVFEVVPGSEVISAVQNAHGLTVGWQRTYALFWADLSIVRDFNLLRRV